MNHQATTSVTPSIAARRMYGTPRSVNCAMTPPATEPTSIAPPPTTCARPKTDSRSPVKPVAASASTSQASVAPEKNVKPRPSRIDAIAQPQNGACSCHMTRYRSVERSSVAAPSRNEKRRPRVSATTPVGTSKITCPTREEGVRGEGLGVAEARVEQEERVDAPDERRRERREQRQQPGRCAGRSSPRSSSRNSTGLAGSASGAYRRGAGGVYRPRPRGMPGDPVRQPQLEGGSP